MKFKEDEKCLFAMVLGRGALGTRRVGRKHHSRCNSATRDDALMFLLVPVSLLKTTLRKCGWALKVPWAKI